MTSSSSVIRARGAALTVAVTTLHAVPAIADMGQGPAQEATDVPAVQVTWVAGVCLVFLIGGLVVARLVHSVRNRLVLAAAALIVLTYPIVWAFGCQDHPWHFNLAANVLAMLATITAAIVFALGEATDPPLSKGSTVTALVATVSSVGVARFWDFMWQPGSDVIGGPGVVFLPLAWTAIAVAVAWIVVAVVRRRADGPPTREHA